MFLYLFYFFVFYLLFRLVVNFIIPLVRTFYRVRQGFKAVKEQMNQAAPDQAQAGGTSQPGAAAGQGPNKGKVGEYIDFEEV